MKMLREFFRLESAGGILLAFATCIALIIKNSSYSDLYNLTFDLPVILQIGKWSLNKPLLLWINDGLMAIFFLLVALEIKREFLEGELAKPGQIILPSFAALGGMLAPALVYTFINWSDQVALQGWAIPVATDIAFALGFLSLFGSRVPKELKLCLVTIAILDDIASIGIIAIFYTPELSVFSLYFGFLGILALYMLNKLEVNKPSLYVISGIFLWVCVLKSGVHATLAGVIVGFFIPLTNRFGHESMLKQLERDLHPWVAFGVLPLFAFANSGVSLSNISLETFMQPITLGIILGLCAGAPIGVILASGLAIFTKLSSLPNNVNWKQYVSMSMLTGVGFTMSLFIGTLAFADPSLQDAVRIGVLFGSIISASVGMLTLYFINK